jgi:Ca2+-binding EF-hand superfamily protein
MTLSELRHIFEGVDTHRKGKITRQDLVKAIRGSAEIAFFFGLSRYDRRDEFVDTIFQALDVAGSHEVTWQDFHRFYFSFSPVLPSFENVLIDDANMLASTHNVKFEICCRHTYWGETLAVCGASPLLGEWNHEKALRLTTSPGTFPKWCSESVNIDQGTAYKFVILQHNGSIWWETQKNRMLPQNIPSGSCVLVAAHFERPGVVFEAKFEIRSFNSFKFGKPGMASSELRDIWDKIDVQRKGNINRRDLIKAIRGSAQIALFFGLPQEFQQEDASRANFEAMFQAMDVAGSREVTWQDFHTLYVGFAPILPDKKAALVDSLLARTPIVPCLRATQLECVVTKARSRRFQRPRISNPISRYGSKAKQSHRAECTMS